MADLHSISFADLERGRLGSLIKDRNATVWPFCDDYEHNRRVPGLLPASCEMAQVNPALNQTARELMDFMINIDDHIWPASAPHHLWAASDLSDRGPNAGDLALNIARRVLVSRAAKKGGHQIVVTDDRALGNALVGKGPVKTGRMGFLAKAAIQRSKGALRHCQRIAAAKVIAPTFHERLRRLREADVLLAVWAGPRSFRGPAPEDSQTNMGPLPQILADAGLKVGFLALPLYWIFPLAEIYRNVADSGASVVMIDELLSAKDVLVNSCHGLTLPDHLQFPLTYDGIDLSHVLWHEALLATRSDRAPINNLFRLVGSRLAALGLQPAAAYYAYEFQPWERGLVAGLKDALPSTRTIGIQVAPFAYNYLSILPSHRDIASPSMPDHLIALGKVAKARFRECGVPENQLTIGGALRFDGLTFTLRSGASKTSNAAGSRTILCCLGMEFSPAVELACKAIEAINRLPEYRLTINFHPLEDATSVKRAVSAIVGDAAFERVTYSSAGVRELAASADTVLYNTSGAAIEACWSGIPVIFVGQDGRIDHDKLPDGIAQKCRTVDEIVAAIRASQGVERSAGLQAKLDEYILPVEKDAFLSAMQA